MKFFALLTAIIIFASCKKNDLPDDIIPQQIEWSYDGIYINQPAWASADTGNLNLLVYNNAYPGDAPWIVEFNGPDSYGRVDFTLYLGSETGDFDFGILNQHVNGTSDSIYGSGFFNADTIYFSYHYEDIEDNTQYGDVEIHSY